MFCFPFERISNFNLKFLFARVCLAAQVQAQQPLLAHLDTTPGIHTIQESQQGYGSEIVAERQQSPKAGSSRGVPARLVVKKKLAQNHIEELNLRLQRVNQVSQDQTDGDINPSVGDISDKDSDVNIQHLESTVSSLSGHSSGGVASPEIKRNKRKKKPARDPVAAVGFKSIETDFWNVSTFNSVALSPGGIGITCDSTWETN